MNTETTVDWECWEVEEPPSDFVERVMEAAQGESRRSGVRRSPRSVRFTAMLAAAAVAGGSLTVLAMIGQRARQAREPSTESKSVANAPLPVAASSTDVSTASRVPPPAQFAAGTVIDRQARDAMRARLVPPLEARGVERDPHTGLTIPAGASGPAHNLSKAYIQARVREDFYPLAFACYASALAKQPSLRGSIVVDFMIVGDAKTGGIVDQAKINDRTDIADAEFTGCIRESMLSMVFAPPENDGWVTVTYPFQFSPEDEEEEILRDN